MEFLLEIEWRRRADLNRRFYGFANRSHGPLGHVSKKNVKEE